MREENHKIEAEELVMRIAIAALYFVLAIGLIWIALWVSEDNGRSNCDPAGPMEAAQCRAQGEAVERAFGIWEDGK